jgi:hypothetical protein
MEHPDPRFRENSERWCKSLEVALSSVVIWGKAKHSRLVGNPEVPAVKGMIGKF